MFASRVTVLFFVLMSQCLIWISFGSSVDVGDVKPCTTTEEVSSLDTTRGQKATFRCWTEHETSDMVSWLTAMIVHIETYWANFK